MGSAFHGFKKVLCRFPTRRRSPNLANFTKNTIYALLRVELTPSGKPAFIVVTIPKFRMYHNPSKPPH